MMMELLTVGWEEERSTTRRVRRLKMRERKPLLQGVPTLRRMWVAPPPAPSALLTPHRAVSPKPTTPLPAHLWHRQTESLSPSGEGTSCGADLGSARDYLHHPPTCSTAHSPCSSSLMPRLSQPRRPSPRLFIQAPAPELGPPHTQVKPKPIILY